MLFLLSVPFGSLSWPVLALEKLSRGLLRQVLECVRTWAEAGGGGGKVRGRAGEREVAFTETNQKSLSAAGSCEGGGRGRGEGWWRGERHGSLAARGGGGGCVVLSGAGFHGGVGGKGCYKKTFYGGKFLWVIRGGRVPGNSLGK